MARGTPVSDAVFGASLAFEDDSGAELESVRPRFLDQAIFVIVFLVSLGIGSITSHEDPTVGSPVAQSVLGTIYIAAIIGVFTERRAAFKLLRGSLPIVMIVLLAIVSTIWSDEPYTTLRRSFVLLGTCAFPLYFLCRLGVKGFQTTLALAITIAAILSVALIAFMPDIGLMQEAYAGALRGVFVQKNELGLGMVLGMVTIGTVSEGARGIRRTGWIAAFILMLGLFVGAQSITAGIAAFALMVIIPILFWCRAIRSMRPAIIVLLTMAVGAVIFVACGLGIDELLGLLGRDATLTGRTDLWQVVIEAIQQRPILGYGYNTFFTTHQTVMWDPMHAHNGFLEAALNYGITGVFLVLIVFSIGIMRAWPLFWEGRDRASAWPLFILLFTLATNFSEDAFAAADFRWMALVAAYFLAVNAYQQRAEMVEMTV